MINPLVELALGRIHVGDTLETYQLRFLFCICFVPAPYQVRVCPEVLLYGETTELVCFGYGLDPQLILQRIVLMNEKYEK